LATVHYEQSVNLQNINDLGANQALPAAVWNEKQLPDIVGSQRGIPAVSAEQFGRDLWQRLGGEP
jgi:hypothetical protein